MELLFKLAPMCLHSFLIKSNEAIDSKCITQTFSENKPIHDKYVCQGQDHKAKLSNVNDHCCNKNSAC